MFTPIGRSDSATGQAVQFAKGILEGSSTAFYEVDDDLKLTRFMLSNVSADFHRQYVESMNRLDPLHPKHAADKPFARLSVATEQCFTAETAAYRSFANQWGIVDMVDFFFRRNGRIVAGMSIQWGPGCKIPDGTMDLAAKIHDYLEFNLVGRTPLAGEEASRYGLTSRELDVIELVCCGRTNREISECLGIGHATVKTHLIHIFEKLGVETRSAVVAMMSKLH
ncbi:helix-turn-helix transcriptional regulator [Bradyrhizobium sp. KB893862 SZCCT0404]|uniref:helix-turn-helix transcriptional regulator n=1 Tax=Bradyrhizobium sp. KB893862 SZCCT0404 TaxID=2807672 RepID=UPI001BAAE708|nr:helix-turn-helix transcriptional regulator [Bradyrhizobium sp. KB893862 SZCCT0404]MBR1177198.1 helix-turn-helix transcriptional regulator [Bradyrhizobium sp. KB893862 SZCCT0404]